MPDKKPNHVLWLDELEAKGLPATQLERIKFHPDSEDLLTWNLFATLKRCQSDWLTPWLRICFAEMLSLPKLDDAQVHLWPGRQRPPTYPPPHSRLYHYKLREYQQNPDALRTKLPHRAAGENPIDFELMSQRIAQAYWDDLINLTDEKVKQDNTISASDWQRAMEDFRHKGLVNE
jgi:hypothetical protein